MAGNVYSTYELAKKMAEERMRELEQDIFICSSKYQSGREFTLKTRDQVFGDYLYAQMLPFIHHFKSKSNAEREAGVFASKIGKPVYFDKRTELVNGYNKIKHYYLTHVEPCLI